MSGTPETALLSVAIEPKTRYDGYKLAEALARLTVEDGALTVHTNRQTGAATLAGMGEVHLSIAVDRIQREFGVEAFVGRLEVVYRDAPSLATGDRVDGGGRPQAPTRLEPVMRVEVTIPHEHTGGVTSDLLSRRGSIQGEEDRQGMRIVSARVPLAEMFGYAGQLRQRTRGRGTFTMQLAQYQPVPGPDDADDWTSVVGSPCKPAPKRKDARVALPEPDEDSAEGASR